ncbi:kinase-like protein [Sporormia fimetaria CBS 119925]|uniref:Kinase-like protein n=1 Tax=Sporormia fimetaria CBS 119925 TaxID=1340428 RepID=A0A6A6VCZ1_9PLEO|nr:kinase-like protein [Sporormia fimetaria CBS 119925]
MTEETLKQHAQPLPLVPIPDEELEYLSFGSSSIVYVLDEKRVLKQYDHPEEGGITVERQALERLGLHANIIRLLGFSEKGLILERGQGLRRLFRKDGADHIPLDRKIQWLRDAAEGMRHMHDNGTIHADVGCHNWVIVEDRLRIIDFEGCSIDGGHPAACYQWFNTKVRVPEINRQSDIFAFGCAIYEVMTGRFPHQELADSEDRGKRSVQLYAENQATPWRT